MENNYQQKINCTVQSCKFNDQQCQKCNLQQIIVEPIQDCNTKTADESMCGSYENRQQQNQQYQQFGQQQQGQQHQQFGQQQNQQQQ